MPPRDESRDPMQRGHHCGRAGQVGAARVFTGGKAGTLFKCHNCQHAWQVPDSDSKPQPDIKKQ
jgi:hypothetical protein